MARSRFRAYFLCSGPVGDPWDITCGANSRFRSVASMATAFKKSGFLRRSVAIDHVKVERWCGAKADIFFRAAAVSSEKKAELCTLHFAKDHIVFATSCGAKFCILAGLSGTIFFYNLFINSLNIFRACPSGRPGTIFHHFLNICFDKCLEHFFQCFFVYPSESTGLRRHLSAAWRETVRWPANRDGFICDPCLQES